MPDKLENLGYGSIAYVAGLLEGEACFVHTHNTVRKTNRGVPYDYIRTHVKIEVQMTDGDVLEHLYNLVGGNFRGPYTRQKPRKPVWRWQITGQRAIELMRLIYPLMGQRRQSKINECIDKFEEQQSKKGTISPEARARWSIGQTGKVHSEASKQKTANSLLGYKHSEETRTKMSAAHQGHKHSPETRAKISAAQLGKKRGPCKRRKDDETMSPVSAAC